MRSFELVEPKSLEAACTILAGDNEARPIAGGTALLTVIKQGLLLPKTLVNLYKIRESRQITYDPQQGLTIGALASIGEVEKSASVLAHYPALAHACHVVANVRIRHMATLGGNLAHGDPQSDPPTMLAALDAEVELTATRGKRRLGVENFLFDSYETALEPGELISALLIPPLPSGMRGVYLKFTTGSTEERPCVGVAALLDATADFCRALRLAIGAVSPKPIRVRSAEEEAKNKELHPELIERIAAEASRLVEPIDDWRGPAEYKRHLVRVLTRRAITSCLNRGDTVPPS